MRTLIIIDDNMPLFEVTNDPQQIIGDFLAAAANDPDHLLREIAEILSDEGDGYYLIDKYSLFMADYPDELPESEVAIWQQWHNDAPNETIWLLSCEGKGKKKSRHCLIKGKELQSLFAQIEQYWGAPENND
jgi:hypothetical protein